MELADYLVVLRKYWISILAVTLIGVLAAAGVSLLITRTYTASTSVFLTVQSGDSAGELQQGSTYAENQVKSFAQVVTKPVVLDAVIKELSLPTTSTELANQVTASVPAGTAIIEVDVLGTNPELTCRIAEAIGRQLIAAVGELSPAGSGNSPSVKATIIAPPVVPTSPTSPRLGLNLTMGALLGLLIGLTQAMVRRQLDNTIVGEADAAAATGRSVVGAVTFDPAAGEHPLVFTDGAPSLRAEAYRRLRTNLQFLFVQTKNRSLVVTSSVAGEGKTTTALNLAFALADAGERVLLVDADLRLPKVASYLNLEGAAGLTTVLIGRAELRDVVQPVSANLDVLPAGQLPPNPAELLGSDEMSSLLALASQAYGYVVVDCAPTLAVTDSALLAQIAGGTLVVVGSRGVHRPELVASLAALESVDSNIMGLVLNKLRPDSGSGYGYRHYRQQYSARNADSGTRVG